MYIQMNCPDCEHGILFDWAVKRMRCTKCDKIYRKAELFPKKKSKKRSTLNIPKAFVGRSTREIAARHEKAAALLFQARQTIASGQTPIEKADVVGDLFRMECKTTKNKSFSVTLEDLEKLYRQSSPDEIPVYTVELDRNNTKQSFCVVAEHWMKQLLEAWKELYDQKNKRSE